MLFSLRNMIFKKMCKIFSPGFYLKLSFCSFRRVLLLMGALQQEKNKPKNWPESYFTSGNTHIFSRMAHTHAPKNSIHHATPYSLTMCDKNNVFFVSSGMTDFFLCTHTRPELTLAFGIMRSKNTPKKLIISIRMGWARLDQTFFVFVFTWNLFGESSTENWCMWQALDATVLSRWSPLHIQPPHTNDMTKTIFFSIIFHSY